MSLALLALVFLPAAWSDIKERFEVLRVKNTFLDVSGDEVRVIH